MLFFDYEKVFLLTGGNVRWMLPMFEKVAGYDFIKNPEILYNDKFTLRDRVEYVGLCSLRNYEDYANRGILYLDRDLIPPWVPEQILADNKLIELHKNYIKLINEHK